MLARRAVLALVTPASELPLDIAAVKTRLQGFEAADGEDDANLLRIMRAVVGHLDGERGILGGRSLLATTWREKFERWPCNVPISGKLGALELAMSPIRSISSLKYYDADGIEQTMSADDYELGEIGNGIGVVRALDAWPGLDPRRMFPITVEYVAGFAEDQAEFNDETNTVCAPLVEALMLHVGSQFEHRDALGPGSLAVVPLGYDDLVAPYMRPAL